MKLEIIAFTKQGGALCHTLCRLLTEGGHDCRGFAGGAAAGEAGLPLFPGSLQDFTKQAFRESDGLIVVGACGIAVRAIAPHLRDKLTDPAVLVVDEGGQFVISLLCGHVGGANELAKTLAAAIGAVPVITTATDVNGLFSVDTFAKKRGLYLSDRQAAKEVSARLLSRKAVCLYSDFPIDGPLPEGILRRETGECGICISLDENKRPFECTLNLIPRLVTVGIGCKRGTLCSQIEELVLKTLSQAGISIHALVAAASIDRKGDEPGLLEFCQKYSLPLRTFSSTELSGVKGSFTPSRFVKETVGVDNVCERAAVLAGGELILPKRAENGVTVALARREWRVCFD